MTRAHALQADPSAGQFGFGLFEVVDLIAEIADDRGLAILEHRHAETGRARLDQLQEHFTELQKLQVDVTGENALAKKPSSSTRPPKSAASGRT